MDRNLRKNVTFLYLLSLIVKFWEKQDAKILDNEFNKILDWITELIKAGPTNYQKAEDVLNTVHDSKNELKMLKTKYQKDLNQEIKNRDLSPEKI